MRSFASMLSTALVLGVFASLTANVSALLCNTGYTATCDGPDKTVYHTPDGSGNFFCKGGSKAACCAVIATCYQCYYDLGNGMDNPKIISSC
ncbi:hypothetical protein PGT21_005314 [Puccinia graminis f. sp. tritici]|uniref:Uncharacterized protein n=1 Tax=Puccinia graminis f. sp. tritici TaxID=56615 RepID=A0A5B0LSQ9_PUCGR|nr:hypothetical protein PGT21_005314 [Puccinia graminis f. sp. tritici]KAA1137784.1 hypothetical protein PGTUg99_017619 [Puccinia graminis f. sp. tritici]